MLHFRGNNISQNLYLMRIILLKWWYGSLGHDHILFFILHVFYNFPKDLRITRIRSRPLTAVGALDGVIFQEGLVTSQLSVCFLILAFEAGPLYIALVILQLPM